MQSEFEPMGVQSPCFTYYTVLEKERQETRYYIYIIVKMRDHENQRKVENDNKLDTDIK